MNNITIKIADKEIPLRFRMDQFIELEEELGNLGEIRDMILTDKKRLRKLVFVIRVLGQAGLKKAGEDAEWLTEEWLRENMKPHHLMAYQIAVLGCLQKEEESQAAAEDNENKERDLVLEEIQEKKGPVNSHTGE